MSKRILIVSAALLALTACAHGVKPTAEALALKAQLTIDPKAMRECPDLPQPTDGEQSTLLANHVDVARLYHDCKADHHGLIEAVKGQRGIVVNGRAQ